MREFEKTIYSDGTRNFVSNRTPALGERVEIRLQVQKDPEITHVFLMYLHNGAETYQEMELSEETSGTLGIYRTKAEIREPRFSYHFVIACEDTNRILFYTQAGITTYVPDNTDNFVLLAGYRQPDWVDGAVFYQIFPSAYGGLNGIREKIPYLKELGVTALYLNPIFRAPSAHKYDCVDYFHVDEDFGGDEALAELSDALHLEGMKLILDISINHTGIGHPWTKQRPDFYHHAPDGSFVGWAGYASLPVLDYRKEEVRELIYKKEDSVLRKWLKPPYNIDGWRFDVADVFGRNDKVQLADELWPEICSAIREENPEAFIIGEHWGDCSRYLQGDLWNTPMNYYGFGRILRQYMGLPELFLARTPQLAKIPYAMTAEDVDQRTREHYRKLPQVIADSQMNLVDSHDVPRIHNYECTGEAEVRMILAGMLFWTGIPCIYYGDEVSIDGYVEHDSGFRYPIPAEPYSGNGAKIKTWYQRMIVLRKEHPSFAEGSRKVLWKQGGQLVVARFFGDEAYVGIFHNEDMECWVPIPVEDIGKTSVIPGELLTGEEMQIRQENSDCFVMIPGKGAWILACRAD